MQFLLIKYLVNFAALKSYYHNVFFVEKRHCGLTRIPEGTGYLEGRDSILHPIPVIPTWTSTVCKETTPENFQKLVGRLAFLQAFIYFKSNSRIDHVISWASTYSIGLTLYNTEAIIEFHLWKESSKQIIVTKPCLILVGLFARHRCIPYASFIEINISWI